MPRFDTSKHQSNWNCQRKALATKEEAETIVWETTVSITWMRRVQTFFFSNWFEREWGGGGGGGGEKGIKREREWEKDIGLLSHLLMHSSIDSCMCPDQEIVSAILAYWDDAVTDWANWPGPDFSLIWGKKQKLGSFKCRGSQVPPLLHPVPRQTLQTDCGIRTWPEGPSEHATIVSGPKWALNKKCTCHLKSSISGYLYIFENTLRSWLMLG